VAQTTNIDLSTSAKVIFEGSIRRKQRQANLTIDVVIPVLNEESCIEALLQDVMIPRSHDWFQIQNIYVISDASTDQTHDIVQRLARIDFRIKLIKKPERKGKYDSINLAFSISSADVVLFIDADVRLADEHSLAKLIHYFQDDKIGLVQGGLVRVHPGFTRHEEKLAAHFDWIVVDKIRRRKAMSWWSIDARVMALTRDFYRQLVLPCYLADDQFIFYSCIQQGRGFVWADDAIFYYGPPDSMADFSHQWSRYFFYTRKSCQYFGDKLIRNDMSIPGLRRTIMSCLFHHPLCGLMWLVGFAISRIEFMLGVDFDKYERGFFWTKSNSLKISTERIANTFEAQ